MKFIAVPILMILILAQSFGKWVIVLDYTINKEYIAQNLCENRSKPKLHCNGKCQLAKKLAEEEKQNSSNTNGQGKLKFEEVLFTQFNTEYIIAPLFESATTYHSFYIISDSTPALSSIFHPPCC